MTRPSASPWHLAVLSRMVLGHVAHEEAVAHLVIVA
jgi:hypothetical protein